MNRGKGNSDDSRARPGGYSPGLAHCQHHPGRACGRIAIGLAAVIAGAALLASAGPALAVVL
jgi:hypothetical protein